MSYTLIDNDLIDDSNLSHTEFRVMMNLVRMYNLDLGYAFPTRETLIKKCKMNKDTLGKVLNSLEEKGYITRGKRKTNKGWNNIYYINKYLIAGKKYETKDDQAIGTEEFCEDKKEDSMQISINEKLIEEQANLSHLLSDEQLERLNKMDTDRLIKVIKQANKYGNGRYSFNYLLAIYKNYSYEKECSNVFNSNTVKTRYHGSFNEHFRNYTEHELEQKLLKKQNDKKKG